MTKFYKNKRKLKDGKTVTVISKLDLKQSKPVPLDPKNIGFMELDFKKKKDGK